MLWKDFYVDLYSSLLTTNHETIDGQGFLNKMADEDPVFLLFEKCCGDGFHVHTMMTTPRAPPRPNRLSRLEVTNELFGMLVNRMQGFDMCQALGLTTFGDHVEAKFELSPSTEGFRTALDGVEADGETALWDAIESARAQLGKFCSDSDALDQPPVRPRIVVLTDGADTKSILNVQTLVSRCVVCSFDNTVLFHIIYTVLYSRFYTRLRCNIVSLQPRLLVPLCIPTSIPFRPRFYFDFV
jgi:hypothetical protein